KLKPDSNWEFATKYQKVFYASSFTITPDSLLREFSNLYYKLDIDEGAIRRRIGKIKIPRLPNYKISNFFGEGFSNLNHLIKVSETDNSYTIKTNHLPSCRFFQVTLEGAITHNALENIVRIQKAVNKDNTLTFDKYWLNAMINDVDTLEKIYKSLEVNEVNCSVQVNIENHFTTELPKSLIRGVNAMNEFLYAGRGSDRHKLFQKWMKYRHSLKIDRDEITKYFENLLEQFDLYNYILLDDPFFIGNIGGTKVDKIIPSSFSVDAITDLSFRKPVASGYLKFHKKNFKEDLRTELKERWDLDIR
ncbi:MAG: hypothetical protein ACFFD2_25035, partial [Promethearchaeota archaeon]